MKALICGATGQDGSYLAKFLIDKGYDVIGTSRDAMAASMRNWRFLGINKDINLANMALTDFRSVLAVIQKYEPDEIYNLAGQTSVGLSFDQPVEAINSIVQGTLNLVEAIRFIGRPIKLYNAGSSECFGDTGNGSANENTQFRPCSPYALGKSSAYWIIQTYREAYQIFGCTGILFNHESPLRSERFVTQKIVRTAASIAHTGNGRLELGNTDICRDWGWAPDYVEAMWLMLQQEKADDYVIATGRSCSLSYFAERTFRWFELDWQKYLTINLDLQRPNDILRSRGDPSKANEVLNWRIKHDVEAVIDSMCAEAEKQFAMSGYANHD